MDPVTIGVLAAIGGLTLLYFLTNFVKNRGLPPGPSGLPLLGYLPFIKKRGFLAFEKLGQKYGAVVSVRFGTQPFILLNSYAAVKEALVTKGDNFSGRIKSPTIQRRTRKSGILSVDGPLWQEHRRFSLHVLRDFGFGRNVSEEVIKEETDRLCTYLDERLDQPVNSMYVLLRCVSNVICTITLGEQPGFEDPEFDGVINGIRQNLQVPFGGGVMIFFPFLERFWWIVKHIMPFNRRIEDNLEAAHDYIRRKIDQHRVSWDPNAEPRDFTDAYLLQQKKFEDSGESHSFTEWQLIRVIFELFVAGTDTTSNSLSWLLVALSLDQDLQARIHKEIDNELGRERSPTMKDRKGMHLVQASLDEVQRYASIVPGGLIHRNFEEDTVQGYRIPANTLIIANVYAVHRDPKVWEKPDEFHVEHFLDDKGHYRARDEFVPFLIGRRSCLGESLAKMELFLFTVTLLQHYSVALAPEDKCRLDDILLGSDGLIRSPGKHSIVFSKRD